MLGFRLVMAPVMVQQHTHRLTLEAKQLLALIQTLRDPFRGPATKGIAGMIKAHEILSARNARGVLIGGVAEGVLAGHGPKRLEQHKDVDVMVFDDAFELSESFEGGIDWWLPHNRRVSFSSAGSSGSTDVRYWDNCNGVVLSFGAEMSDTREPGLYLPPASLMRRLRMHEVTDGVKHAGPLDNDTVDRLGSMFERRFEPGCGRWSQNFFQNRTYSTCIARTKPETHLDPNVVAFCPIELDIARAVRSGNFVDH